MSNILTLEAVQKSAAKWQEEFDASKPKNKRWNKFPLCPPFGKGDYEHYQGFRYKLQSAEAWILKAYPGIPVYFSYLTGVFGLPILCGLPKTVAEPVDASGKGAHKASFLNGFSVRARYMDDYQAGGKDIVFVTEPSFESVVYVLGFPEEGRPFQAAIVAGKFAAIPIYLVDGVVQQRMPQEVADNIFKETVRVFYPLKTDGLTLDQQRQALDTSLQNIKEAYAKFMADNVEDVV